MNNVENDHNLLIEIDFRWAQHCLVTNLFDELLLVPSNVIEISCLVNFVHKHLPSAFKNLDLHVGNEVHCEVDHFVSEEAALVQIP